MREKFCNALRVLWWDALVPWGFYLIIFSIVTYPQILSFSTHLWADKGDGYQNTWNLWWVNEAIVNLKQDPWFTTMQHYPHGSTLLGHPLNLYAGLMGVVLIRYFTLIEVYNLLILSSFALAGWTMYMLSKYITKSYWPSLIAGYIFTFSHHHFAYSRAQLELANFQWLPLFMLLFLKLVENPTILRGVLAGLAMGLVLMVVNYHFLFAVFIVVMVSLWMLWRKRNNLRYFVSNKFWVSLAVFGLVVGLTSGVHVKNIMLLNDRDPILGAHLAQDWELDIYGLFIPDRFWRFNQLTKPFWVELKRQLNESGTYMGISTAILFVFSFWKRKKIDSPYLGLMMFVYVFFAVLALGRWPQIGGYWYKPFEWYLPYEYLSKVFPVLKLAGVPIRMTLMTSLASAVISAIALKYLIRQKNVISRVMVTVLMVVMVVDFMPAPMERTKIVEEGYVAFLRQAPMGGSIYDSVHDRTTQVFNQTMHHKPIAVGSLARRPKSVKLVMDAKNAAAKNEDFWTLHHTFKVKYLVTDLEYSNLEEVYEDDQLHIYDLAGVDEE